MPRGDGYVKQRMMRMSIAKSYLFRLFRFFRTKFDIWNQDYNKWQIKEYLISCGVSINDFDSYTIDPTAQIYASSKLRIGRGLDMGECSVINSNDSYGIYIGDNLLLASDVYIRGGNHDWSYSEEPFQDRGHCAKKLNYRGEDWSIVIEDNVWCGHGSTIISGAHIGKGAVIGAGAVVGGVVPPYSVVIGNPFQIVSNRQKHTGWGDREDIGLFT